MSRPLFFSVCSMFFVTTVAVLAIGQDPKKTDASDYRTIDKAITAQIKSTPSSSAGQSGYLGVNLSKDQKGRWVIAELAEGSPAAKAGLQTGDELKKIDGQTVTNADMFRETIQAHSPGAELKLIVGRKEQMIELKTTLAATSKPMKPTTQRAVLGISLDESSSDGEGAAISRITPDSPAAKAALKVGEYLVKFEGEAINNAEKLNNLLAEKKPGDAVTLTLKRENKEVDLKLTLAGDNNSGNRRFDLRETSYWKKEKFRLAVVCVEYPDTKHNDKVKLKDWEELFFSKKSYTKTSPTGQTVYGSVYDYYQELSYSAFHLEGKVFDWVTMSKKRADYSQGTGTGQAGKTAYLTEVLDKLLARDGKDALKDFDGIIYIYAGGRVQTSRGGLYWPHRSSVTHNGKRWAYAIFPEGGERMTNISVICHEFGHVIGLPDLYARPENPGSEGAGVWCAMSNQNNNGRPQHFSAWCKEKMGWIKPTVIDPTVKQKLILDPIEDSPKNCYKVLVKLDGSEYFLLENRTKKGFDRDLPAEGLIIWRVVGNRPILEESHGVDGPSGPRMFLTAVPYPSPANQAFTPYTTPSSRSQLGGGLPVHLTNIKRLPNGRVTFQIGYEYQ